MWKQDENGTFQFASSNGVTVTAVKRAGRRGWMACFAEWPCIGSVGKTGKAAIAGLVESVAIDLQKSQAAVPTQEFSQWTRLTDAANAASESWILTP